MSSKAVVLASGGLDSTVAAAVAKRDGCRLYLLTIAYGQRHRIEIERARLVARAFEAADHRVIEIDLRAIGGSALTSDQPVPKDRPEAERREGIPSTYVPARNTVFLSLALGWAEVLGARDLVVGVNALDYSGYPDCRPAFIAAFEELASVATAAGVGGARFQIHAPLIQMSKAQIIRTGLSLGLDYGLTHSCYDPVPTGAPCRRCDSCVLRAAGFAEAGAIDPLIGP